MTNVTAIVVPSEQNHSISELTNHTPNLVYSDLEYMEVLERDLGITFRFGK